jgi:nucleoside triphosphate diphosphatase
MHNIDELLAIMARLRDPQLGCPWDREQTFATIVPYTIEEAYEVADAIERGDMGELKAELGDLLFQVVFYAQIANEAGSFDFNDVVGGIVEKMIRRHPHVFAAAKVGSAQEQAHAWEQHKAQERASKAQLVAPSLLDDIPRALPALTRAMKLHKRASRIGFDWQRAADVLQKLDEEVAELRVEIENDAPHERVTDELGDLLFVTTILARHSGVDPESALRHANAKFERRFQRMETLAKEQGRDIKDLTLQQQDALWNQVKAEERGSAIP